MIDIHNHILYGVDDGAEDYIDSKEMLRIAAEDGVTDIISTPHCIPGRFDNYNDTILANHFNELDALINKRGSLIRMHRGMEVFADESTLANLDAGKLLTLAGSHYILVECAFDEHPGIMTNILQGMRERRLHPIIAHPERYFFIHDNPEIALDWVDIGCSLQLNAGSITGIFGRTVMDSAYSLLREGAVQFVASDAHGPIGRTPELAEAYERVGMFASFKCARMLFNTNPARVLADESLEFPPLNESPKQRESADETDEFMSDEEFWSC